MSQQPPKRKPRLAAVRAPDVPKTDQLLGDGYSARQFEVRDRRGRPRFGMIFLDTLTSEEFCGRWVQRREKDGILRTVRSGGLGAGAIKCYLYIAAHTSGSSGAGDHPWPLSVETMANAVKLGRNSVYRATKELEDAGLLEISRRSGRKSLYGLLLPPSLRSESKFPINGKNEIYDDDVDVPKMGRVSSENGTGDLAKMGHPYREETEKITNNSSEEVICDHEKSHLATTTGTDSDARRAAAAMQRDALEGNLDSVLPGQLSLVGELSVAPSEPDDDPYSSARIEKQFFATIKQLAAAKQMRDRKPQPIRTRQPFDDTFDELEKRIARDPLFAKGTSLTPEKIAKMREDEWLEHLKERGDS